MVELLLAGMSSIFIWRKLRTNHRNHFSVLKLSGPSKL